MQFDWEDYRRYKITPADAASVRHADVVRLVGQLPSPADPTLVVRQLGESFEGRSVSMLSLGRGPRQVLAWTQMHGDEPTHTSVVLDLANFLQTDPAHPVAATLLAGCTLHLIPMLNPDGAERWTRANAQGVDVNRDALDLVTPEARILSAAVDQLEPQFAFNLHNHNPRATVALTGQPASIALMVPPVDAADSQTESTRRARLVASTIVEAISDRAAGRIARYVADFMPGAFGEVVQQRGASTVLIEAGGWPGDDPSELVQLHFIALLAALEGIASDAYTSASPTAYTNLPPVVSAT